MSNRNVIVCIDDEKIILDSLDMELEQSLPEVDFELLQNQGESEELVRSVLEAGNEIAVIVCDYIMPGRRGDEVLASLHRLAPNARTVMLTGQSSLEGITNAINQANLYRYIAKPWNRDDLILTLKGAYESYVQDETIKRQNRELKNLNENLEQKVIARTQKLHVVNEVLVTANREIKEYLSIIDQHVIITRISNSWKITYVSEAMCRMTGFNKHELIGKNFWHTIFTNVPENQIQMKDIIACIEQGKIWEGETQRQTRNGDYFWVHEIIAPRFADESVIIDFANILHDITDKKTIEKLSITDALTGLFNRRYFDQIVQKEIDRSRRSQQSLALCLLDVDHFKAYNDNYGHLAGDNVLRELGKLLMTIFKRGADYVFRVGGEEFALLFPIQSEDEARNMASALLKKIEELDIKHGYNSTSSCVTVSLGVRVIPPTDQTLNLEMLYSKADELLYRAKKDGRNRFVLNSPD